MIIMEPAYYGQARIMSTRPGKSGHEELQTFARKMEMLPCWIKKAHTPEEHYMATTRNAQSWAVRQGAKKVSKEIYEAAIDAKKACARVVGGTWAQKPNLDQSAE